MIYTVTLNPSLDYIVKVNELKIGETNRTSEETIQPGGKGINVSIVLHNLSLSSIALGFLAGFTGKEIENRLSKESITCDMIHLPEGMSRINCKLQSNEETEVNGMGPKIDKEHLEALVQKLKSLTEDDILVLSGSIPPSLSKDIYADLISQLSSSSVPVIVDTTGSSLLSTLPSHPFLIKPNRSELEELSNHALSSVKEIFTAMKELQKKGARNIITSLGRDGAVMLCETGKKFACHIENVNAVNTVGAGDSLVAGFIASYFSTHDYQSAFIYSVACATASACSEGFAEKDNIVKFLNQTVLTKIQ